MILTKQMAVESGGFVSAAPIKKTVTWLSGGKSHEADVFVRLKSYQSVMAEIQNGASGNGAAARIASSIVDETGQPVFTVDDITGNAEHGPMSESLTVALLTAISEANGLDVAPGPKP
ncbi:MAG TPA: phage tail protein [Rheinheimera sp.]|nr:phage tail protein [Rheinheimera sp.]